MPGEGEITRLLAEWSDGNKEALNVLLPLVYDELRRTASSYMRRENPHHILQTTALVHEAYLRLVKQRNVRWQTRTQFFAVAAQVMRHILIDHARGVRTTKRGGGVQPVQLDDVAVLSDERAEELIAVDCALERLSAMDSRKGRIVELRYFGGMSVDETAEALKLSPVTVARDWRIAKAWLRREITMGLQDGSRTLAAG